MNDHLLIGLAMILAMGVGAQWLSWRLRLPAILVLLLCGFIVGPIAQAWRGTPWVNPNELFGEELLSPIVSVAVAIILFEGGLSLKLAELRLIGRIVRNLVTIGVATSWVLGATAAYFLIGLDGPLALLLGAILVVTGPTVIIPLLRQVRPSPQVGSVLKWEGMLIDPIGAMLAVLVFEWITTRSSTGHDHNATGALFAITATFFTGTICALIGALLIVVPLRRYWIPDYLQSPATLAVAVLAFAISNHFQAESGLLAVTVMGLILANQRYVTIQHIVEFKENLRVLLISSLFIILAARLEVNDLKQLNWGSFQFLLLTIVVIRPISVWLSTIGSGWSWQKKLLVSAIAPRGIVAASVTSIFAIRLLNQDYTGAEQLVPHTFLVIVGTILFCALTSSPLARWLSLSTINPQGVLFVGAHDWARALANTLKNEGFEILMVDTNRDQVLTARMQGLNAIHGSILSEDVLDDLDLSEIRRVLAITANDQANALATLRLTEYVGREGAYQLPPADTDFEKDTKSYPHRLHGRYLFSKNATAEQLGKGFERGAVIKATKLTQEFNYESFKKLYGTDALPLMVITETGQLRIAALDDPIDPKPSQCLISLVQAESIERRTRGEEQKKN